MLFVLQAHCQLPAGRLAAGGSRCAPFLPQTSVYALGLPLLPSHEHFWGDLVQGAGSLCS